MKREFAEMDLPLAQSCLARVTTEKDSQHLVKPFRNWVDYLKQQIVEQGGEV